MFVINANGNGNGYATSASSFNDIPLDGSFYTMFATGEMNNGITMNVAVCTSDASKFTVSLGNADRKAQSGNNQGNSVVDYGHARRFDEDVIYPFNNLCSGNGNQFQSAFGFRGTSVSGCSNLSNANGSANFSIPNIVFDRIISRKTFDGGECVGKTINSYLGLFSPLWCKLENQGYRRLCNLCPYVEIGLFSCTGGIRPIKKVCYTAGTNSWSNSVKNILWGVSKQSGLTANAGDRLYLDFGLLPSTATLFISPGNYATYGLCGSSIHQYAQFEISGTNIYDNKLHTVAPTSVNSYFSCWCNICGTNACSPSQQQRFNGIQISVD